MNDSGPLRISRDGGLVRLTLDRPDVGNAIDLPMARALAAAALEVDADPAVRCVVIAGAGRMFCAGGDVGGFAAAGERAGNYLADLAGTLHLALARFARMAKPLITIVQGPAAGAGFSLAMAGDVVLAGASAHFTPPYGAIGLTPDGGLGWLLPRLVGLRRAQEILLTNRRVPADEAAGIGLVTRTIADGDLAAEALKIATMLARGPTAALGQTRSLLLDGLTSTLDTHIAREARSIAAAGVGLEGREGIAAFLAKRPPDFTGIHHG